MGRTRIGCLGLGVLLTAACALENPRLIIPADVPLADAAYLDADVLRTDAPAPGDTPDAVDAPENCGAAGQRCCEPDRTCREGACASNGFCTTCGAGQQLCDGRCVDPQSDNAHCGACGNACAADGSTVCARGQCIVSNCPPGAGDCNRDAADGCETQLSTTVAHCGTCGNACQTANGTPGCIDGACVLAQCNTGFRDCDGLQSTGCEADVARSLEHCGSCGVRCAPANAASAHCEEGRCFVSACNTLYGDCNNDPADGCETDLARSTDHCGACNTRCTATGGTAVCNVGRCGVSRCDPGRGDCDGNAGNGCETSLRDTLAHCGACGAACPALRPRDDGVPRRALRHRELQQRLGRLQHQPRRRLRDRPRGRRQPLRRLRPTLRPRPRRRRLHERTLHRGVVRAGLRQLRQQRRKRLRDQRQQHRGPLRPLRQRMPRAGQRFPHLLRRTVRVSVQHGLRQLRRQRGQRLRDQRHEQHGPLRRMRPGVHGPNGRQRRVHQRQLRAHLPDGSAKLRRRVSPRRRVHERRERRVPDHRHARVHGHQQRLQRRAPHGRRLHDPPRADSAAWAASAAARAGRPTAAGPAATSAIRSATAAPVVVRVRRRPGGTATCTNGTCNQSCPSGQANCNGTCRNLATDPQHCGACGMACAMGLVCAARVCACPSGQTLCSGACVDLRSNADHCGMCGVRCASGMCQAGACACPAGQTACGPSNDTCVDTQTDAQHCGGCGRACMAPTARCMGGMCVGG
jgi:hypothetical protein